MAESLDSRKFERKAVFDVPLPIRRAQRDVTTATEETAERDAQTAPDTMAFALMTKRGNRQQVRCTLKTISNSFILIKRIISSFADRVLWYRRAQSNCPRIPTSPSR
jgi:regulator of nonsense transcripts 2